jgi:GTPase SAR1 family protein
MVICFHNKEEIEQQKKSREIEKQLAHEKNEMNNHIKLLLLGAGESGKSTIAKQLKIIHMKGFTQQELNSFKPIIFSNIVNSMRSLIEGCNKLQIPIENSQNAEISKHILDEQYFQNELTPQIIQDIKTLWADPSIQKAFSMSNKFQLIDSAEYYFNNIDRIGKPDYIPTVDDVLRSRAKTTGVLETNFTVDNVNFTLVDVGGQRSERRKWMHCFQDVTAVIFCVALSEYDKVLYEDETVNRMHESLKLFKDICNAKWFNDTTIILFLNKKDLFQKKIETVPLKVCFEDYTGGQSYEETTKFIEDKFLSQNENSEKLIYVHYTCATDTNNIQVVFKAVQDSILSKFSKSMKT